MGQAIAALTYSMQISNAKSQTEPTDKRTAQQTDKEVHREITFPTRIRNPAALRGTLRA